ncbi:MAG TPA: hypothetical protein VLM79_15330, partial [Kofleriaceae bacterium]|nr:hypothetical protein [Kofleriaceae bacterium]
MARRSALAISGAVHGALALVAVIAAHERTVTPPAQRPPPIEIEFVGPSPAPPSPERPPAA